MIWYSSDLHYNHKMVAKKRGFTKPPVSCGEPEHFNPCNLCAPGDPEAHDAAVLGNWNRLVKRDDRAYILGDFAMNWDGADELLAQMNGEIILVCGNHDIMSAIHRDGWKHREHWTGGERGFAAIMDLARRKVAGYDFLMSHYPYAGDHTEGDRYLQYRLRDYGMWLLHGHTHGRNKLGTDISYVRMTGEIAGGGEYASEWTVRNRQIHVGVDAWDLCPVSEKQILALMDEQRAREQTLDRWGK